MKKLVFVIIGLTIAFGLVACSKNEEPKEVVKDVTVDPSAKTLYKTAMTELYFNDNVAPLEKVHIKIDGTEVTADEALQILKNELKEHKYVQEYFNLAYNYKAFEKQDDGSFLLVVKVEFADGNNKYQQEHQVTFTGEPGNFKISSIDIKTEK